MTARTPPTLFTPPDRLGYDRSRTMFAPEMALRLDESYRLAHLPLVNPAHPDVIAHREGKSYAMGIHPRVHSLVLPVSGQALAKSAPFRQLQHDIQHASFAAKIAWDVVDRRAEKLHATIAGSLGEGEAAPILAADAMAAVAASGPFRVRVEGLFSGNINLGRLYLKVYPEWRKGSNAIHDIQRHLGRPPTDMYLVGLYNLTDHLTTAETSELAQIIDQWWSQPLLETEVSELWLLSSRDDLVLDSRIEQRIFLFSP